MFPLAWLLGWAAGCGQRPLYDMKSISLPGAGLSGCPSQRQPLSTNADWDAFWSRCQYRPEAPPQLARGLVGVCLGERASGGGSIRARAYLDGPRRPVVLISTDPPGGGGPLAVVATPCAAFEVPLPLVSADWTTVSFAEIGND